MLTKENMKKVAFLLSLVTIVGGSLNAGGAGGVKYAVGIQLPNSWGVQSEYAQKYTISVIEGFGYWLNDSDILGLFGTAIRFDDEGSMGGGFGGIMLGRDFRIGKLNVGIVGKLGIGDISKGDQESSEFIDWVKEQTKDQSEDPRNDKNYNEYYSKFTNIFSVMVDAQLSIGYTFTKWLRVEALGGVTAISNFENGGPFKNEKIWFPYLGVQASFGSFK